MKREHPPISDLAPCFGPRSCSCSRRSRRSSGATCPTWSSERAGRRFCWFLRRSPWRSSPGCSRSTPRQQAGSMPPTARFMSPWHWSGYGSWMGCRSRFGTWWAWWWSWRGWGSLWAAGREAKEGSRLVVRWQEQGEGSRQAASQNLPTNLPTSANDLLALIRKRPAINV